MTNLWENLPLKNLLIITVASSTLLLTTLSAKAGMNDLGVNCTSIMLSGAPAESATNSSLLGAELQYNFVRYQGIPFTLGIHGLIQNQRYGSVNVTPLGLGASINYYHNIGSTDLLLGAKKLTYFGDFGDLNKNSTATYAAGEDFFSVGVIIKDKWIFQIDKRISNKQGNYKPNTNSSLTQIPNPELIFHIGINIPTSSRR